MFFAFWRFFQFFHSFSVTAGRARLSPGRPSRNQTERGSRKTLDRKIGDRKMETKFVQDQNPNLGRDKRNPSHFSVSIFLSKIFVKMTDFYLYYSARRGINQIAARRAEDPARRDASPSTS